MVEAETKLKTEVTRIKKKLQIQITELEMSLDVANRNNIELQKTIKKQSLHLTVKLYFMTNFIIFYENHYVLKQYDAFNLGIASSLRRRSTPIGRFIGSIGYCSAQDPISYRRNGRTPW